jgi:hypothetical protein
VNRAIDCASLRLKTSWPLIAFAVAAVLPLIMNLRLCAHVTATTRTLLFPGIRFTALPVIMGITGTYIDAHFEHIYP